MQYFENVFSVLSYLIMVIYLESEALALFKYRGQRQVRKIKIIINCPLCEKKSGFQIITFVDFRVRIKCLIPFEILRNADTSVCRIYV